MHCVLSLEYALQWKPFDKTSIMILLPGIQIVNDSRKETVTKR